MFRVHLRNGSPFWANFQLMIEHEISGSNYQLGLTLRQCVYNPWRPGPS
jgi:hypothetical protein